MKLSNDRIVSILTIIVSLVSLILSHLQKMKELEYLHNKIHKRDEVIQSILE